MAARNEKYAPMTGVRSQIQIKSNNAAIKSRHTKRTGRCEPKAISTVFLKNSANLRQTPRSGPAAATPVTAKNRWDNQCPAPAEKRRFQRPNKKGATIKIPEVKMT